MSKQQETIFGERVDRDLKEAFGEDIHITNVQQVAKAGDPDRILCIKGKYIALELKIEGGKIDTLQLVKLLKIKRAGGIALRVYPLTWSTVLSEFKIAYASR